jgi:quercetin dioxygenase-like cupin family protein
MVAEEFRRGEGGVMAHAIRHADEVETQHGVFKAMRRELGATAFGVNQLQLGSGAEGPEHDHSADGQEEVYVIIGGSGKVVVDGEEIALRPGHYVFLSPEARRKMIAGEEGLTWVGIGSQPGAYKPRQ